ncbi:hypothetical protein FRC01_004968, partial [Tulasnella sp. 417]
GLTTEKLQRLIFGFLGAPIPHWAIWASTGRNDLVSIARTCQAFTEVALDILYHDVKLESLLQVWHAKGILRRVQTPSAEPEEIVFDRVPNSFDYQRLSYYSRRVRVLNVRYRWYATGTQMSYGTNFFPTFIEAITNWSTQQAEPFPQLQSLTWSGPGEVELVSCEAIILASPRLKAFTYGEYRDDSRSSSDSWPTLLRTLASAQSLERIEINLDLPVIDPIGPGTRAGLALCRLIMKPNLKELHLPDYVLESAAVVSSFASARHLERLTLSPAWKSVTGGVTDVPRAVTLDRLSHLGGTLDGMKTILAGPFVFRALTTITTDDVLQTSFYCSHLRTFFGLVGNGCPVIETLHISGYIHLDTVGQRSHFVLAPLRACTRMQHFMLHMMMLDRDGIRVHVPQDFNPTDMDWSSLISSWPDLHKMSYYFTGSSEGGEYYRRLDPGPRGTTRTLMGFSRNCRQLVSLVVPLTVTLHDTSAALQDDILPFGNFLRSMGFTNYSIEDDAVDVLAKLLLRLTWDDVGFDWSDLQGSEEGGFDLRSEKNLRAAIKLIDFIREARPTGTPPAPPGVRCHCMLPKQFLPYPPT